MGTLITFSKWPCNSNSYNGTWEPQVPIFSAKYIFAFKKKKTQAQQKTVKAKQIQPITFFISLLAVGPPWPYFANFWCATASVTCSWGQWNELTGGGVWVTERQRELAAQGHSQVHSQMSPGPSPKAASWVQTSFPLIFQFISWPCASGIVLWNG